MSAPAQRECRTSWGDIRQPGLAHVSTATDSAAQLVLPADLNSLRFEFFTPEYRADGAVLYSHRLDNYDKDWSSFSRTATKEYTKLPTRRLHPVRQGFQHHLTRNRRMLCEFQHPAAVVSVGLGQDNLFLPLFGVLYGVWMAVSRKMKQSAQRMERRRIRDSPCSPCGPRSHSASGGRDESLKTRQIEQDIQYKTEELSSITMNVVRKNEILLNISSRLSKVRRSIEAGNTGDAGSPIARIQAIIEENINYDDDWQSFSNNFDAVYYDFYQRLRQSPPRPHTHRSCACAATSRMGLKARQRDGALFNISYRSVEMTRYRLRKKLGLDRATQTSVTI